MKHLRFSPLLLGIGATACRAGDDFRVHRADYEATVATATAQLATAAPSKVPGCNASEVAFRTSWGDLTRLGPGAPNVLALQFDGSRVVRMITRDVHGDTQAYAWSDPPMTAQQWASTFDRCGGGEWEKINSIPDAPGWVWLQSSLD